MLPRGPFFSSNGKAACLPASSFSVAHACTLFSARRTLLHEPTVASHSTSRKSSRHLFFPEQHRHALPHPLGKAGAASLTRERRGLSSPLPRSILARSAYSSGTNGSGNLTDDAPETSLTVNEVKQLLESAGIEHGDIFEKRELVQRLQQRRASLPLYARERMKDLLADRSGGAGGKGAGRTEIDALFMDERNTVDLFRRCAASVAMVTTSVARQGLFSLNLEDLPRGTGSGIVWDRDGHIVTNFHVIQGASSAKVGLNGGADYDAKLVAQYPDIDLAVLKIQVPPDQAPLQPIAVTSSSALQVGQRCFAIGNPFGLDQTLTGGIVSGLGRDVKSISGRTIHGVVQTDAAINPGNSGGPLLDSRGRMIGINTMIYSPSGASAGVGFAVPSDTVRSTVNDLLIRKGARRPELGVVCFNDFQAKQMGVKSGALVSTIKEGSAVAKSGLQATSRSWNGGARLGDLIVGVGSTRIASVQDLKAAIESKKVGDQVKLVVEREGKRMEIDVTLGAVSGGK